jgi:glycosyltransferase involved in cell wall biosynthesis
MMVAPNIRIIGSAFGPRDTNKTFSGIVKHLFEMLNDKHVLVGYLSTKQVRFIDVLGGMLSFSRARNGKYRKPGIRSDWLWKSETVKRLSGRFNELLSLMPTHNIVFQVGTHVHVEEPNVIHYCFTDMTVAQATDSAIARRCFGFNGWSRDQALAAIEVQKSIFRNCEAIFVSSDWTKNSIVGDYGIAESKVYVVLFGASLESRCDEKKAVKPSIIFVGRDWERKGGPILLDAFQIVRKKLPDVTLTIVGCSPKIRNNNIKVLGCLNKSKVSERVVLQEELAKSMILCVPSLFEPFGVCFSEAQYYGIPPVTFEGEGRNSAIIDGVTGLLVKERSAEALSEALLKLLLDPQRRQTMAKAAKEFAEEHLTWDAVANRILEIIIKYTSKRKH